MTEQDKQALIKHFCSRDCGEEFAKECAIMPCHEIELIQEFPTTGALNSSENPNNSDCISRQAAKDMIKNHKSDFSTEKDYRTARACVNAVPPAQPEIIRCKDCKHWIPYDWMFSEVWQSRNINDYPEHEIGCNYCDMAMKADDFCSRAERKEVTE